MIQKSSASIMIRIQNTVVVLVPRKVLPDSAPLNSDSSMVPPPNVVVLLPTAVVRVTGGACVVGNVLLPTEMHMPHAYGHSVRVAALESQFRNSSNVAHHS